jgi:POT family proton-dependent oligopeptide transporter
MRNNMITIATSQPKALPFLFLTEMWERFGFYVVQGMLVLYMTKSFGFSDNDSYTIMGVFSALAYIAPFPGGVLADRFLGFKTAVIWGGIFLSTGYAMLALWTDWKYAFYVALATIIVGNGLFKPNVSSLLGSLYAPGDPRRESGFTIFYIGINLGVLLSGGSGFIKDHFGWGASFGLASIGLILGLIIFTLGFRYINTIKIQTHHTPPTLRGLGKFCILTGCLTAVFLISLLLQNQLLAKFLLPSAGIILLAYLVTIAFREKADMRNNMLSLIALILSSIIFWMIFLQLFFSATLFIDRVIDKSVFGFTIPTTAFYALESVFVILLGPAFAWSWQTLSRNQRNPAPFTKFIYAIGFVGLGFLTLAISTFFPNDNHLINPLWIAVSYGLLTVGEMLLSPIGLSAVTTLAPRNKVGMMMGIWFVATGFGGQFAGLLAKIASIPENITDLNTQLTIYRTAFLDYTYIALGVAASLFTLQLLLKKIFSCTKN